MSVNLLPPLRDYLIAQGAVRKPSVAAAGKHPLWLEPRLGTPAPGEGQNAVEIDSDVVLGAFRSTGIVWPQLYGFMDEPMVEFRIRSRLAPFAEDVFYPIRAALHNKRQFSMGGLTVHRAHLFRDLARLGSDADSYDWSFEIRFLLTDPDVNL